MKVRVLSVICEGCDYEITPETHPWLSWDSAFSPQVLRDWYGTPKKRPCCPVSTRARIATEPVS